MDDVLKHTLEALKAGGKTHGDILGFLYSSGLSIAEAMVAIRSLYAIKLADAKKLVANSEHYASAHDQHRPLHDALDDHADACNEKLA